MCVCVCVCVCEYIYIYIYTLTHTHLQQKSDYIANPDEYPEQHITYTPPDTQLHDICNS